MFLSIYAVINAVSDKYHPLQALADIMILKEHFGQLKVCMYVLYVCIDNLNVSLYVCIMLNVFILTNFPLTSKCMYVCMYV